MEQRRKSKGRRVESVAKSEHGTNAFHSKELPPVLNSLAALQARLTNGTQNIITDFEFAPTEEGFVDLKYNMASGINMDVQIGAFMATDVPTAYHHPTSRFARVNRMRAKVADGLPADLLRPPFLSSPEVRFIVNINEPTHSPIDHLTENDFAEANERAMAYLVTRYRRPDRQDSLGSFYGRFQATPDKKRIISPLPLTAVDLPIYLHEAGHEVNDDTFAISAFKGFQNMHLAEKQKLEKELARKLPHSAIEAKRKKLQHTNELINDDNRTIAVATLQTEQSAARTMLRNMLTLTNGMPNQNDVVSTAVLYQAIFLNTYIRTHLQNIPEIIKSRVINLFTDTEILGFPRDVIEERTDLFLSTKL